MKKRISALVLALALLCSVAAPAAVAAEVTQPYMTWLTNSYQKQHYLPLGGTLVLCKDWHEKYGVLDTATNQLLVPCNYTSYTIPDSRTLVLGGYAVDRLKGTVGTWDGGSGKNVPFYGDGGLTLIEENGKQGYFSPAGAVLVPAVYDEVHAVGGGKYILAQKGDKWGVFDHSGKVVFPFLFPSVWFDEGSGRIYANHGSYLGVAEQADYLAWSKYAGETVQMGPAAGKETVSPVAAPTLLDGRDITLNAYLFKVNAASGSNFVKLRDVAALLSGTAAQFEVGWDQATSSISLTTGKAYTVKGGELTAPANAGPRPFVYNSSTIYLDGKPITLDAYTIDQNNYFKLRDLGEVLGFKVDWQDGTVVVETK